MTVSGLKKKERIIKNISGVKGCVVLTTIYLPQT